MSNLSSKLHFLTLLYIVHTQQAHSVIGVSVSEPHTSEFYCIYMYGYIYYNTEKSLKMKRDVGMACQKVKVNIQSPVPTSFHNRVKMYIGTGLCIFTFTFISFLVGVLLARHSYISFHFQ